MGNPFRKEFGGRDYIGCRRQAPCGAIVGTRPRRTCRHRHTALQRMTMTHTIMVTVRLVLRYPWKWRDGSEPTAIGQKLSRTLRTPALSVLTDTNESGM